MSNVKKTGNQILPQQNKPKPKPKPKPVEHPKPPKVQPKPPKKKDEKKEVVATEDNTVHINSLINEIFATSEVTQAFTNTLSNSIELQISFPLKPEIQLSKFVITIGDKTIISKVLPKEKAEEKYTDSIASGNTGFLSTMDESGKNYTIRVGKVLPQERVILKSVFNQMITSQDMSYEFVFLEHYPCFIYSDKLVQSKKISGVFTLKTKSKITRLISPYMDANAEKTTKFDVKYNEDYTEAKITFEKKIETESEKKEKPKPFCKFPPKRINKGPGHFGGHLANNNLNIPRNNNNANNNTNIKNKFPGLRNGFTALNYFCFLFRTEKMNKPMLYYQYDPEKKETAYCLNYVYNSKNMKEIPVPQKPDQDNKISYYSKYQENLMNDTPGLFIFLVDQSGSMRGNSIDLVKKALILFMQSLPQKSYFQLIGFGTDYKKYNESPIEYKKENVKPTLEIIKGMQANMGGTNISSPLKDIFENKVYDDIPLARNIFLLTDGQVFNRELCINLISTNSSKFRIQAIGIGNDFDKILIERAGKLGNGSSAFVEDVNKINEVVIETLNRCLRPYLININFGFANKSMLKNPILINQPMNNFTYQDEVISYGFILSNKNAINFEKLTEPIQVEMFAKDPLNEVRESIILKLDDNITKLNNGENLLKTIVGQGLKFNKQFINTEEKEVEFAKKYQMLSKNTALFGEILRDDSQQTSLIKVDINEERKNAIQRNIVSGGAIRHMFMHKTLAANAARPMAVNMAMPRGGGMKCVNFTKSINLDNFHKLANASYGKKKTTNKTNNFVKKPSYEQKSDGTIGMVDEFNDMLMAQDIIEGCWDEVKETKYIVNKIPKGGFEKIVEYVKSKNISQDFNKIVYTILAIYYIEKIKAKNIKEYRLVLNKGKKYLMNKGINYDQEIKNIKI